jgi:hypothetical protein
VKSAASRPLCSEALGKHASQTCSRDVMPESITTDHSKIASACAGMGPGTRSGQCSPAVPVSSPKCLLW